MHGTLAMEAVADGVVLLTLNRPERGNGVVPEMAADLVEALSARTPTPVCGPSSSPGPGGSSQPAPTSRSCASTSTTTSPTPGHGPRRADRGQVVGSCAGQQAVAAPRLERRPRRHAVRELLGPRRAPPRPGRVRGVDAFLQKFRRGSTNADAVIPAH